MVRRCVLMIITCLTLAGCQALAQMQAQEAARQQAVDDNLRERIAQLSPEQKDTVQKCSSISAGRISALRNAGQGGITNGMNDYTVVDSCLSNAYFYETIPAPAVVVNVQPPQPPMPQFFNCTTMSMGGGMSTTNCN